jgi:putative ABC transport system ATP-binding protein
MKKLNENNKTTFLFSTHDPAVIKFAKKVLILKDGKIANEKISSENTEKYSQR